MRRFIYVLALLILNSATHCEAATKPKVTISVSPLDKDHIKLEYKLPPACKSLKLFDPYPGRTQSIRQEWRAINDCGAISQNELLKPSETCTTVEFAVPIQAKVMDRVNPIAYPFYEQGVMVHTGQKIKVACTREYKFSKITYELDGDRLLSLMNPG